MIKSLKCTNFKCIDGFPFELNNLTIFSGYNGRGKSSVLQSLLMLSQSVDKDNQQLTKLHMSGIYVDLGSFTEILTNDKKDSVNFEIGTDDSQYKNLSISYKKSEKDKMVGEIMACKVDDYDLFGTISTLSGKQSPDIQPDSMTSSIPESIVKMLRNIHYIAADRIGPVKYVDKTEVPEVQRVNPHGLNTINILDSYTDMIPESMNLNDESPKSLEESVSIWLNYIMDGGNIQLPDRGKNGNNNRVLSLNIGTDSGNPGRCFSAYNVGFGYSYILSIIITALIAPKGSIVMIENPEAHLHSQAQSRLTRLLSLLVTRGVQVLIETHSEHIVNGFRLEMLRNNCDINHEDCNIYFFDNDYSITRLVVNPDTSIDNWPSGFFDQELHDLAELRRLRMLYKSQYR